MATVNEPNAAAEGRLAHGELGLLQILVGIRLRSVSDPESRRHLTWLSDIAAAMALMSRRAEPGGPVDFAAYLDDAVGFWKRGCEARGIRIDVRASVAALPQTHALPLAIIVHELMSNATRHAFAEGTRGSIAVAYSRAADGVSLVVRDSGQGAADLTDGDGLALVRGLVEHLKGTMVVETAPGAGLGVRIRLPFDDVLRH